LLRRRSDGCAAPNGPLNYFTGQFISAEIWWRVWRQFAEIRNIPRVRMALLGHSAQDAQRKLHRL
jgi:hypothetical protein